MFRIFQHTFWVAAALAALMTAPALADPATEPAGALAANGAVTAATPDPAPAPDAPPLVAPAAPSPAPAAAIPVPVAPASQPAVAATTPAVETPYRGSIEKMPIHSTADLADARNAAATQAAPATSLKSGLGQSGIGTVIQVGGALCIVLGLIFIGRVLARKFVPGAGVSSGKNVIEILARYPLAKAQSLVMVRIGSQIVVLNQTKDASTSILVISEGMEVASILGRIQGDKPNSIQAGFTRLLANAQLDLEKEDSRADNGADAVEARMQANQVMEEEQLDEQLDEMAAAKRQLMELRQQVRSIRDNLAGSPITTTPRRENEREASRLRTGE